tara:strand:- start:10978 stop:12240 length:1263 start_codon:yes stop_codon:yes gene_type:complete
MRYSHDELQRAIQQRYNTPAINESIKGYPLLHSLLIEWREERETQDCWVSLFNHLIQSSHIDFQVRDCHGDTPLHSIVKFFHKHIHTNQLVKFFVKYADANVLNRSNMTPLECAVKYYSAKRTIIKLLLRKTDITPELRRRCQQQLEYAMSERDTPLINTLMTLKLAHRPALYVEDRYLEPSWFRNGVWIRMVSDGRLEDQILTLRHGLPLQALPGHCQCQYRGYTPYSPATFIKPRIPVNSFGRHNAGVIIRTRPDRFVDYWYDGGAGEQLTKKLSFTPGYNLSQDGYVKAFEHHNKTENEISQLLSTSHDEKKKYLPAKLDRFGILASRPHYEFMFWNEGLFRYQREDIAGIVMVDDGELTAEDFAPALKLKRQLFGHQQKPYFQYKIGIGSLTKLPTEQVRQLKAAVKSTDLLNHHQ